MTITDIIENEYFNYDNEIEFINLWNEYIKAEKTTIMKLFL